MRAHILLAFTCAGWLLATPVQHLHAAQTNAPARKTPAGKVERASRTPPDDLATAAGRPLPYRGTVKEVDVQKQVFTIGKRTFHVNTKSRILKEGKPCALAADIKGEWVTGSYRKSDAQPLEVISLYIGAKPAAAAVKR